MKKVITLKESQLKQIISETIKRVLMENEPNMTRYQNNLYNEPSEPDYDINSGGEYHEEGTVGFIVDFINKEFSTRLQGFDGEYTFPTNDPIDLMIWFDDKSSTISFSAYSDVFHLNKEIKNKYLNDFNVNELVSFFSPYKKYILTGKELENFEREYRSDMYGHNKLTNDERNFR